MIVLAAACLLLATACSEPDDGGSKPAATPSPSSTALDAAGDGEVKGGTEEVPFDDSELDSGAQSAPDSPAVVLVPSDNGRQTITARVTITSVEKGKIEQLVIDDLPPRRAKGAQAYFVSFKMEYVSGPVQKDFGSVYLDLVSGDDVISDEIELFSGLLESCGNEYQVKNFGEGAVLEGCTVRFVTKAQPAPDGVAWTAPLDGTPSPQVTWPLA